MAEVTYTGGPLPVAAKGRNSVGWLGVLCLIATEACLFAYLLFSYFYIAIQRGPGWSPEPNPSLAMAGPNTLILLASSVAAWWGEGGAKGGQRTRQLLGLSLAILLGAIFLIVQVFEWKAKTFRPTDGSYGSLYFTITGFHMAHVVVGLAMLIAVTGWSWLGLFQPRRHEPVSNVVVYWHFVDAVWLAVFATFYLAPHLMW
ncbi:cytochrome c oxidase subunit 3 [Phenylobacterium sp.]|uniref:cytochrome c oxidase subunit 3 n=1 Tax=Phenylobacterium sp. TaxID=1871053 RepID=UPI00121E94D5|nr:cytochrome c oxidase subunit 3 [Phenylobacterium sp.]THD61415.1 MAG: heme-copper oxidase subunit III [Phenylobacterium sp.]